MYLPFSVLYPGVVHVVKYHVFTFLDLCCAVPQDFRVETMFFIPICFVRSLCFIYVICIYLCILVSNKISMSDDIRVVLQ